jgi:hypothetical protein
MSLDSVLPIEGGLFTKVDAQDAERFAGRKLTIGEWGYVRLNSQPLHRIIADAPRGKVVDHINGDPLDNRRANLRVCTQAQNLANGRSHRDSTSRYRGVSWKRSEGVWRAQISVGGQRSRFLGQYRDEEAAARAYDEAARAQYGEYARLNFPIGIPSKAPSVE